ncbi:MAG: hypothetical protein U0841_17445 [Chloroflexia bacterium]
MNARQMRILGIIADLEAERDGQETDEFSIAQACGAIPEALPRHAWVKHPSRGELLQLFTALDHDGLIYVTRRGYWGFHLTQRGREALAAAPRRVATPAEGIEPTPLIEPMPLPLPVWEGPRPSNPSFAPRNDHFYSTMALAVAALGALLILAFGQSTFSPLARDGAAAADASPTLAITLPPTSTPLVIPSSLPTPTIPVNKTYVVAHTGGDGVFLRRTPQYGDKMAAWPEKTILEEIGPERNVNGVIWRYVRAPDDTEGYVPAQYVEETH